MESQKQNLARRILNRAQRRNFKNRAQMEGRNKKYYTTKQTITRTKRNGKKVAIRKDHNKQD